MMVSQAAAQGAVATDRAEARIASGSDTYARVAGASLLVALASIMAFQIGGSAIGGGTRPDDARTIADVAAYFGHPALAPIFLVGLV